MGNLEIIKSAFKGQRVLITGDTGFKGSWLALWLKMLGAEITGLSLPPQQEQDHYNVLGLKSKLRHIDGDIRNFDTVRSVFQEAKPMMVFHLAAQPLVRHSYKDPKLTYDTNIGGSVNILEAVRLTDSIHSVVYITSDKCYKNKEWVWGYRENDELGGFDPYSSSKAAAEIVFSSYMDSFFKDRPDFGAASVRAGNVLGGGDWSTDRIVPDCIRALMAGEAIVVRNPAATRPWQHVLEPLYGYLLLAAQLLKNPKKYSGTWNFGPSAENIKPVEVLARKIVECWGSGKIILAEKQTAGLHEANLLHLCCDKAKQKLNWSPIWNFDRTISETVNWYKHQASFQSEEPLSHSQLNSYMEGLA